MLRFVSAAQGAVGLGAYLLKDDHMGTVTTYSAETASALLDLIDVAGGDLQNVRLPNVGSTNLNAVAVFDSPGFQTGGGQGVLAAGTLAGIDDPVAVIAVSVDWPGFSAFFRQNYLTIQDTPPASLNLQTQLISGQKMAQVALGYTLMFGSLRTKIWTALDELNRVPGFNQSYPLIVVGMGPSGPAAQMIAAEVRPGQSNPNGPQGATSKTTAVGSYAFSNASYGNDNYNAGLVQAVPASFVANLDGLDFYPSSTGSPADWVPSGAAQTLSAGVPATDAPWLERTPAFYQTAFGGDPPVLPSGGSLAVPVPPGYGSDLAYTLSTLGLIAYARFQHPNLGVSPPLPGGYTLTADIKVNDVLWGTVFSTLGKVVVALRGPCSWVEFLALYGQGTITPFPGDGSGHVLTGLSDFYTELQTVLAGLLPGIPQIAQSELYFTGHDFGGSLATMVGYNQHKAPTTGVPVTSAIYGFGTNRFCNQVFALTLSTELDGKSFQITRPADVIAQNEGISVLAAPPAQLALSGGGTSSANSTTGHTLALYNSLLNPRAMAAVSKAATGSGVAPNALELALLPARAVLTKRATDAPPLGEMMAKATAFYGIDPSHLTGSALDTGDHNGWLSLPGNPTHLSPPPAQMFVSGPVTYAASSIRVRAGHNLIIGGPGSRSVRVMASKIHIENGGNLIVATNAEIIAATLSSGGSTDAPMITVTGTDGTDGAPGVGGSTGRQGIPPSPGHPGTPGTNGGDGGNGGPGGTGTCPASLLFKIGDIQSSFIVACIKGNGGQGGNAGAGGPGGNGSQGGDGGQGGTGGNGGNGATPGTEITILYKTKDPSATFTLKPLGGRGGDPGQGGAGGAGGVSDPSTPHKNGTTGVGGQPGTFGVHGTPATVVLQQDPSL